MSLSPPGPTVSPPADESRAPARVSVIMPAYNAAATIARSIASVLSQSHRDLELIVVDDCSRDATWSLIEAAAQSDPRVVPVRQRSNQGVAAARNAGIDAASGAFVSFLDSDDTWHPYKLVRQLRHLQSTGAQISYAAYRRVDARGRTLSIVRPPARIGYADMLKSNRIGNLTGLYDRALGDARFERIGHEDYVFWLRMVRKAGQALRLPEPSPVADYLVREGSLSGNKLRAARWQWRIYRDVERLDPVTSGWYFAHYAGNAILKRQ